MAYISDTHRQTAERVDAYLGDLLRRNAEEAKSLHPAYERLWLTMRDIVFAGGKRNRPYLTMLGYRLGNHTATDIIPVAAAQELLHIATLIHDDVIDRDTIRHGVQNINGAYESIYRPFVNPADGTHYAHSASILAGDLLLTAAHRAIITSDFEPSDQQIALDLLDKSIFEVIGGELIDVEASFITGNDYDSLTIAEHKTASYSIAGPLLTGARLAHASEETITQLAAYANAIGIAFQIQDDLLGLFGDEAVTGKSTTSDIREGKRTYIVEQFQAGASPDDMAVFESAFRNEHASDEAVEELKSRMKRSPAYQTTLQAIDTYVLHAKRALNDLKDSQSKRELIVLTERLSRRTH